MTNRASRRPAAQGIPPASRLSGRLVLLQLLVFGLLAVSLWLRSPGTYHDDDLDHYFMARSALTHPGFFLNPWGRPLFTLLYALPAQLGLEGVRGMTLLVTLAAALLTWRTARRAGFRIAPAAVGLTLGQPLLLLLSFSALVEPLGALLVAALLWAVAEERRDAAGWIAGLLPLARLELAVLCVPTVIWLLGRARADGDSPTRGARRLLGPLAGMATPLLAWAVIGGIAYGDPLWLPGVIGGADRPLTTTGPLHYLRNYIVVAGPALFFGLILGGAALLVPAGRQPDEPRPWFAAAVWVVGFTTLTLLTWEVLKLGGSIGFLRHLIVLAPAATLVALTGYEALARGLSGARRPVLLALAVVVPVGTALFLTHRLEADYFIRPGRDWTRLAPLLPLSILALVAGLSPAGGRVRAVTARLCAVMPVLASFLFCFGTVKPIALNVERKTLAEAVGFLEQERLLGRPLAVNHPWVYHMTSRDRWDRATTPYVTKETLDRLPRGGIVVWENHYGARLYGDVAEDALRADRRYERIYEVESGDGRFRVIVLERK